MGNRIVLENSGLRFAISSNVVREVAAWAEDDINRVAESGR
jgi:hypothetical protein